MIRSQGPQLFVVIAGLSGISAVLASSSRLLCRGSCPTSGGTFLLVEPDSRGDLPVEVEATRGLMALNSPDTAVFRLEMIELQSVLQGAGPIAGVWDAVEKLQEEARKSLVVRTGALPAE